MNSLGLRINKGSKKVSNNACEIPAVYCSSVMMDFIGKMKKVYRSFFTAEFYDQLTIFNNFIDSYVSDRRQVFPAHLLQFFAVAYFESPAKHPVRGSIMKLITRASPQLQESFSAHLSCVMEIFANHSMDDFDINMQTISKMSKCLDFDHATAALGTVSEDVLPFFKNMLQIAVNLLCEKETSPTLKKGIMINCHDTMRLLLTIIHDYQFRGWFQVIVLDELTKSSIKAMLINDEMPMDTKCLCGIVLLRSLVLEIGEEAALKSVFGEVKTWLTEFLSNDTEVLVVYSGLPTRPVLQWLHLRITDVPAVIKVLDDIVLIGERASCDASITVTVARTIHSLAKSLGAIDTVAKVAGPIDNALAEKLVLYVYTVIDHSMDSVRFLAGKTLSLVAKFYNNNNNFVHLRQILGNCNHPIRRTYFLVAEYIINNLKGTPENIVFLIIRNCIHSLYTQEVQAAATSCLNLIINRSDLDVRYLNLIMAKLVAYLQEKTEQGIIEAPVLEIYDRLVTSILNLKGSTKVTPLLEIIDELDEENPKVSDSDLVVVLVVLRASQKILLKDEKESNLSSNEYILLRSAATHPKEEFRILSLLTVVESKKSTKIFRQSDLAFIVHFIKYNINTQSPNFRQLTTSLLLKFVKRLCVSYFQYKGDKCPVSGYYAEFVAFIRAACIGNMHQGANVSRRGTALQLLTGLDATTLPRTRVFKKDDVEKLLYCLEDSYDGNKQLAFDILQNCPSTLLQENTYSISLALEDILQEASSVKPTDCSSAAYKLLLVDQKFIRNDYNCEIIPEILLSRLKKELAVAQKNVILASAQGPMYGLVHCIRKLLKNVSSYKTKQFLDKLFITLMDVNNAVAPIVNNMSPEGHLPMDLEAFNPGSDVIMERLGSDASRLGTPESDESLNSSELKVEEISENDEFSLPDGKTVTSQMVLLCGWRSVKEVSLLLGDLSADLPCGLISDAQLKTIGEHFIKLLSETKHRGAFEQAYVGFTKLVPRLWRSESPDLHALPAKWLAKLMAEICSTENNLCPTRRSAGLPYIIQALVTTEISVNGNGNQFRLCMDWLIRNAGNIKLGEEYEPVPFENDDDRLNVPSQLDEAFCEFNATNAHLETDQVMPNASYENMPNNSSVAISSTKRFNEEEKADESLSDDQKNLLHVEIRTHCLNILRALYRNTNLGELASNRVQEGLMVAICGLDARTWQERNSATLLLNSLIVRVFGVQRSKDSEKLNMRNKMTGRIFFLRYPAMHEFMMDVLKYSEEKERNEELCHSLFGVLLILSRLYQSSLEGTDSNFKLSTFVEPVMRCGSSSVLQTRRLAAKAVASIVPPHLWHSQVMATLNLVGVVDVQRNSNQLHGTLLQLTYLLESAPGSLTVESEDEVEESLRGAFRIVFAMEPEQRSHALRYIIRNELLTAINKFSMRFNRTVITGVDAIILANALTTSPNEITPYYHLYIVNLIYFTSITHLKEIQNGTKQSYQPTPAVGGLYQAIETNKRNSLTLTRYEILLAEVNILMLLSSGKTDEENMCEFLQHLQLLYVNLRIRRASLEYVYMNKEIIYRCLTKIIREHYYLECKEKSLKALNSLEDTAKIFVDSISLKPTETDDDVVLELIRLIRDSPDNRSKTCLQSLLNLLKTKAHRLTKKNLLICLRLIHSKSSAANSESIRELVMSFVEANFMVLMNIYWAGYTKSEMFEHKAILWCTLMTFLEDDMLSIRERAAELCGVISGHRRVQLATAAGESLRLHVSLQVSHLDERMALMLLLALYDFHSEVCMEDQDGNAFRVFDQNERHNVYLEEYTWTNGFGTHMLLTYQRRYAQETLTEFLKYLMEHPDYKGAIATLCDRNIVLFKELLEKKPRGSLANGYYNSKVAHFVRMVE